MCAEMHAGFAMLRAALMMNFEADLPGKGWNVKVQAEIDRLIEMWQDAARPVRGGRTLPVRRPSPSPTLSSPHRPAVPRLRHRASAGGRRLRPGGGRAARLPGVGGGGKAENDFYPPDEPYRTNPRHFEELSEMATRLQDTTRSAGPWSTPPSCAISSGCGSCWPRAPTPMPATRMGARPSSRPCWATAWACWGCCWRPGPTQRPGQGRLDRAAFRRPGEPARDGAVLIGRGADLNRRDSDGATPLWRAVQSSAGHPDLSSILRQAGAKDDSPTPPARPPASSPNAWALPCSTAQLTRSVAGSSALLGQHRAAPAEGEQRFEQHQDDEHRRQRVPQLDPALGRLLAGAGGRLAVGALSAARRAGLDSRVSMFTTKPSPAARPSTPSAPGAAHPVDARLVGLGEGDGPGRRRGPCWPPRPCRRAWSPPGGGRRRGSASSRGWPTSSTGCRPAPRRPPAGAPTPGSGAGSPAGWAGPSIPGRRWC